MNALTKKPMPILELVITKLEFSVNRINAKKITTRLIFGYGKLIRNDSSTGNQIHTEPIFPNLKALGSSKPKVFRAIRSPISPLFFKAFYKFLSVYLKPIKHLMRVTSSRISDKKE